MCGIVGYVGPRQAAGLLIEGLRRLEYRGYDSSGLAIVNGHGLKIFKQAGKLSALEKQLNGEMPTGTIGIGHPRWATHGRPTNPARDTNPAKRWKSQRFAGLVSYRQHEQRASWRDRTGLAGACWHGARALRGGQSVLRRPPLSACPFADTWGHAPRRGWPPGNCWVQSSTRRSGRGMPPRSSVSTARARHLLRETWLWTRNASAIWAPTVK